MKDNIMKSLEELTITSKYKETMYKHKDYRFVLKELHSWNGKIFLTLLLRRTDLLEYGITDSKLAMFLESDRWRDKVSIKSNSSRNMSADFIKINLDKSSYDFIEFTEVVKSQALVKGVEFVNAMETSFSNNENIKRQATKNIVAKTALFNLNKVLNDPFAKSEDIDKAYERYTRLRGRD